PDRPASPTLPLHDALPICRPDGRVPQLPPPTGGFAQDFEEPPAPGVDVGLGFGLGLGAGAGVEDGTLVGGSLPWPQERSGAARAKRKATARGLRRSVKQSSHTDP